MRHRGLLALFFLSGLSGLIYESIWSRYVRLFVGSAATAQVLVLSLFMGGMSLGALIAARRLTKIRRPIRAYGLIEGGIGLYALIFPLLAEQVIRLCYDVIFPALGGGEAVAAVKWGFAGLLILVPCVLLGMTFPLMSAGIIREDRARSGEILSLLYFTNSLGAALGALLSGFALVAAVGLPGTLAVAGAINLGIMALALRHRGEAPPITAEAPAIAAADGDGAGSGEAGPRRLVLLLLALALGTGLSSFMYEIGWIRLLSLIIGSATHSFEVMLSAFVFGLAVGGLWVRRRMDAFREPEMILGLVQILMGIAAIATLPLYRLGIQVLGVLMSPETHTVGMWYAFNGLRYVICLLIMLPATFCAGMTLPLITHVLLRRGQAEGVIGRVYGLNTLGSIAGAIAAGLVLLPLIGLKNVIVAGAAIDVILGLLLLRELSRRAAPVAGLRGATIRASVGAGVAIAFGLGVVRLDPMVLTSTVFRHGRTRLGPDFRLVSYVDGRTASVTMVAQESRQGYRVLYTNGKPDASVVLDRYPEGRDPQLGPDLAGDEPNQILVGLIPLMARPETTDAALIGFGSGVTCHVLLGSPTLERLDTIEIEPEMVAASRELMPVNHRAYEDRRNHFHFDDAKAFFAGAARRYDLIISEPTNPWVSGVSSLFTVEFYREIKRYLKPGGVLGQWIQGYELSDELLLTVLAALDREFADYLVLRVGDSDWVILASDAPIAPPSGAPIAWPALAEELKVLGIHDVAQVDALMVANKRMLHAFLADRPANADARPLLDNGAERARFLQVSSGFLHSLRWTPAPLLEVFGGVARRPYPIGGIGDLRDPHVLLEAERAAGLMRRFVDPDAPASRDLGLEAMTLWHAQHGRLGTKDESWDLWARRTYAVYNQVSPYLDLAATPWWQEVLRTVEDRDAPVLLEDAIDLLDALIRREGPRLQAAVERSLATPEDLISPGLQAIAGGIALELNGADAATRRAFAHEHMQAPAMEEPSSDVLAFTALHDYVAGVSAP
ncbi:MAG: spermidine synthase [Myxococcales bacterium]|nr:spermidine synthase [Myxococcales bacterium]